MKFWGIFKKNRRYFFIARAKLIRMFERKRPHRSLPEKKQEIILTSKKNGNFGTFIETGTYRGDMVNAVKNSFREIYSIELGETFAENARKRFATSSHIHIIQGDSSQVLPAIIEQVKEPCLFWLDAHHSGDDALGKEVTPIISELKAVLARPFNDAVLIDDARLFNGVDYPTITKVKKIVRKMRPDYNCSVIEDMMMIDHHD